MQNPYSTDSHGEETPNHLYVLDKGWVFTSSHFSGAMTSRCYASIVLTADRAPIQMSVGGSTESYQAVAFRPGVKRSVLCEQGRFICVRLNVFHPQFRRFSAMVGSGVIGLNRELFAEYDNDLEDAYRGTLTSIQGARCLEGLALSAARCLPRGKPIDARIDRVLRALKANPTCYVSELSDMLGISVSRMSHVFRDSLGLPIRTYVRWQRLRASISHLAAGQSLTEVARQMGYTDISHFRREFREIAGVSPSQIFQHNRARVVIWREASALHAVEEFDKSRVRTVG